MIDPPSSWWEQLPVAVLAFDRAGKILFANAACCELLAVSRKGMKSLDDSRVGLFAEDAFRIGFQKLLEGRRRVRIDEVRTSDRLGNLLELNLVIDPSFEGDHFLAVLSPVTISDPTRNESESSYGIMLKGLLHEINNPLAGIRGSAQILEDVVGKSAGDDLDFLRGIVRDVDRIQSLLEEFRQTAFASDIEASAFRLPDLIQERIRNVDAGSRRQICWVMRVDLGLPELLGDSGKIGRILTNLLLNAVTFTGKDNLVRVSAGIWQRTLREVGRGEKWIQVTIEDSGSGVTGLEKKLFTPFYTTRSGGTGLGLALSRGLARKMGGDIKADTSDLGGARFLLTLPVRLML